MTVLIYLPRTTKHYGAIVYGGHMKKIKITKERYLPSERYVDYEHWHRYHWILDMIKNKKSARYCLR